MRKIRRILFAVKNPDTRRQAGIDKAIHFAKRLGASIELFHAISTPVYLDLKPLTGETFGELKREALALRQRRLEAHAARADTSGVTVDCKVEWDYPPHEAIVRRAQRTGADLVIAECHEGSRLKPWLMHLTDWELLRLSAVPVLLFRNKRPYQRPAILAAVDPSHAHAKPVKLDHEVIAAGSVLAKSLGGSLHAMHANYPPVMGLAMGDPGLDTVTLSTLYTDQKRRDSAQFKSFAEKSGIPRARRHEVDGDPVYGIPKIAGLMKAQIVVMGAVSRSGLKRVFIGNTAERVLNSLPCDVLVVKPPRFVSRVNAKSRGMRVVTPPPMFPLPV